MRYLFVVAFLLAALALRPDHAAAQSGAGTTAAVILQLPPSPRPLALGEAYAALATDELGVFYNPARLSASTGDFGLAYQTLPAGAGAGSLAGKVRLGPGVLGAGLQFLNFGEVDVIEPDPTTGGETGIPTGERVGGGELALSLGYGVRPFAALEVGVTAKLLQMQLAGSGGGGAAIDLGTAYGLFAGRVTLAAVAQNLGPAMGPGKKAPLPRTFRTGVAARLGELGPAALDFAMEAISREGATRLAAGAEVGVAVPGEVKLIGRLGYSAAHQGDVASPFLTGAGLALERYRIDYAYRDLGLLGRVHLFGVSVRGSGR